ncbi:MAG: outer membrane beta-barrel protein [bacterium]
MFKYFVMLVLASAMAMPVLAEVDTVMGPHQGALNFNVSGSYTDVNNYGKTTSFNGGLNYFFTDAIAGELGLMFNRFEDDFGTDESTTYMLGAKYYFMPKPENKFFPFLGARFGGVTGSDMTDETVWMGVLGVDFFVAPNISITPEFDYGQYSNGDSDNFFRFAFGLTYWFK